MEFVVFFLIVPVMMVITVINGLILITKSRDTNPDRQKMKRVLAWNLIEPGITTPFVIFYIFGLKNEGITTQLAVFTFWGPLPNISVYDWLVIFLQHVWPMVLLLIVWPLLHVRDADPAHRLIAWKILGLGLARIGFAAFGFLTLGLTSFVGVIVLIFSIRWVLDWTTMINYPNLYQQASPIDPAQTLFVKPVGAGVEELRVLPLFTIESKKTVEDSKELPTVTIIKERKS